ncbi:MAG: hypothetical protein RLZZ627_775 [Pseudomonadota bacterium]
MTNLDTSRLNRNACVSAAVLAALLASPAAMATAKTKAHAAAAPAAAQQPAATSQDALLNALLKNGVINKQQYADLAKSGQNFNDNALLQVLAQNGAITKDQAKSISGGKVDGAAPEIKNAPKANPNDGYARVNEKGIEWGSNDGNFKAKVGGRIQVDSQIAYNDPNAKPGTALSTGIALRRARIFIEGLMYRDYEYRLEYDFARDTGGASGITEAYVKYIHFAPFGLTIGQQNQRKSASSSMSNNYLTFAERALPNNAFIEKDKYQLGAMADYFNNAWGVPYVLTGGITTEALGGSGPYNSSDNSAPGSNSVGGTNSVANNANRNAFSGNQSYQMVGRGVALPFKDEAGNLLHTGVWGSYRSITNNYNPNGSVRNGGYAFASAPDTDVDRTNWASTGNLTNVKCSNGGAAPTAAIGGCGTVVKNGKTIKGHLVTAHQVNDINMFGAELMGAYGPFHMSSEYMMTKINGVGYDSNDLLQGYYVEGGYFITGETRPYDEKKGTWNRVIPKSNFLNNGGWGAWEVAARYDLLDMNTKNINGGAMDIFTLGVNWYLTPRVRLMSDWVHVLATNTGQGNVGASGSNGKCSGFPAQGSSAGIACFNGLSPNIWETAVRIDF